MKKTVLLFMLVFLGIGSIWSQSIPYRDAGSKIGRIIQVQVTGNNDVPIIFKQGTHQIFTITFEAKEIVQSYKLNVYYIYNGTLVPLPPSEPTGLQLPFVSNSRHTFGLRLDVAKNAPLWSFDLLIELKNGSGETIIAFKMAAKVVE